MAALQIAFAVAKYFKYGGMQRSMLRIAQECVSRGHQIDIYTGKWEGEKPASLSIHEINIRAFTNHGMNDNLALRLKQALASNSYDCIVGFTKIPGLDIYYAGDPCLAAKLDATKPRLFKYLPRYRAFLRQEADVFKAGIDTDILLIAHQEKERFIHHYGTDVGRFFLLPPGIDRERLLQQIPNDLARTALRNEFDIDKDQYFLLTVGSGFSTKGVDRAIIALGALPKDTRKNCRLIVVGEGKAAPLLRLAKKHGVSNQIIFTGARDDVAKFYYSSDLLLHPAYTENTGTTLIEAMVCGLPVLTTENCGFAYHINKAQAGLVCPVPFSQTIFNTFLSRMLHRNKLLLWGENGKKYTSETDLYSLIEKASDIIIARAENNRHKP